jgi:hypothetical protein
MSVTEHNNMVKAVPPVRADEPLRISVLPWRPWCNGPIPNAHCSNAAGEDFAVDAIPIANDVSVRYSGFRTTDYVRDWLPIRREQCAKRVSRESRWSPSSK